MSEVSPSQDHLASDNATEAQHDVEEAPQDAATEDNSPEEGTGTVEDEEPSMNNKALSSTSAETATNLQNDSPDFREIRKTNAEPATVVVDLQEANKNFLIELERTRERNNAREFEMERAYSRNTVLSVYADGLLKYPNSRYYKE